MEGEYEEAPPSSPLGGRNYFSHALDNVDGLKYRLDGRDLIRDVEMTLKGGRVDHRGRIEYHPSHRLMNDEGVHAARFMLLSAVNKINHLTKYENEERIRVQLKSLARAWVFQVVRNRKRWDVQNRVAVVRVVENAMYVSMLRGNAGFEAQLITKSHNVNELVAEQQPQRQRGLISRFLGGG